MARVSEAPTDRNNKNRRKVEGRSLYLTFMTAKKFKKKINAVKSQDSVHMTMSIQPANIYGEKLISTRVNGPKKWHEFTLHIDRMCQVNIAGV